jgi:Ni/Co efflux regulator RcnB
MKKTVLTLVASALIAASTVQIAAAAEQHKGRRAERAPAPVSEQFRNANNAYGWRTNNAYGWVSPAWVQPGWSRYEYGAMSAPAGQ